MSDSAPLQPEGKSLANKLLVGRIHPVKRVDAWWIRNRFQIFVLLLILAFLVVYFGSYIFVTVPAGSRAVMFRRFSGGIEMSKTWGEGFHIIPPWDSLTIYETRLQEKTLDFPVLSRDGLTIDIITSVRFHPMGSRLPELHRDIGPEYFDRLIQPEVEAHLRKTMGDRTAYELYSNEGDILQEASQINLGVTTNTASYIRIDELLIRKVVLPDVVRDAIEQKHRAEQKLLEYDYRVAQEEKEADRKRIEATGIRDYNTIGGTISPDLLRWRGIEATLDLATSSNSKIIVIGGGQNGLPIILDTKTDATETEDTAAAPADNSQ